MFVTMKEGFPLEYIVRKIYIFCRINSLLFLNRPIYWLMYSPPFQVDIPLDPFLFEMISSSGAEVDLLQKRQIHYFLKVLFALLPGILILWFIRESMMLLHITTKRLLYKKYNQLFDMAYAENFILVSFHLYWI